MSVGADGSTGPRAGFETAASVGGCWRVLCFGCAACLLACAEPSYKRRDAAQQSDASSAVRAGDANAGGARPADDGAEPLAPRDDEVPRAGDREGDPAVVGAAPSGGAALRPDARAPEPTSALVDAGAGALPGGDPLGGALPRWALPLVGTYAVRSVTFSFDDAVRPPINTRNVELSLLTIVQRADELWLRRQMCSYVVSIEGAQGSPPLYFKSAASTLPMEGRIVLATNEAFGTEPILQHLGFDPTRSACEPGSIRRPKYEDQTWITGASCVCYATSVPEHTDDCRVIDGDGDLKPGITANGPSPLGTTVTDYVMVFDYAVTIVDGQLKPNRAHELREVRAQQPACINTASDGCSFGNNELCPGGSTRLLPVDEQATCATLNLGDFGPPDPFPPEVDCRI